MLRRQQQMRQKQLSQDSAQQQLSASASSSGDGRQHLLRPAGSLSCVSQCCEHKVACGV